MASYLTGEESAHALTRSITSDKKCHFNANSVLSFFLDVIIDSVTTATITKLIHSHQIVDLSLLVRVIHVAHFASDISNMGVFLLDTCNNGTTPIGFTPMKQRRGWHLIIAHFAMAITPHEEGSFNMCVVGTIANGFIRRMLRRGHLIARFATTTTT